MLDKALCVLRRHVWQSVLRIAILGLLAALAGCYAYRPGPPRGPAVYYAHPAPPPPSGGSAGPGASYQQPGPPQPPPPP